MNREIKFRGFQKSWIYGGITIFENQANIFDVNCVANSSYEVDINSVGQFTGLLDKNDKEIYEGDILKTSNNIVNVFFGKHTSYVTILGKKDTIETNGWLVKNAKVHVDVLDESFCNGEVIGNIYENTELFDGSVVA